MTHVYSLKNIPRTGWITHGVPMSNVESVAEHTYSTSILAMVIADLELANGRRVDVERVLRLALLHDLAESLTFDINKSYLEYLGRKGEVIKLEMERSAWKYIVKKIEPNTVRRSYLSLESEFNAEKTVESQIVHAADRLDILFQIIAYNRKGYPKSMLADLWASTDRRLSQTKFFAVRRLHRTALALYKATRPSSR